MPNPIFDIDTSDVEETKTEEGEIVELSTLSEVGDFLDTKAQEAAAQKSAIATKKDRIFNENFQKNDGVINPKVSKQLNELDDEETHLLRRARSFVTERVLVHMFENDPLSLSTDDLQGLKKDLADFATNYGVALSSEALETWTQRIDRQIEDTSRITRNMYDRLNTRFPEKVDEEFARLGIGYGGR